MRSESMCEEIICTIFQHQNTMDEDYISLEMDSSWANLKRKDLNHPSHLPWHSTHRTLIRYLTSRADDERLSRYLRGETLDVSDLIAGEKKRKGWQLVMVAGHPLGFGKLVNNNLKNKYPAGWRKNN